MITDQELRLECLKMAVALTPSSEDPRRMAEAFAHYVRAGFNRPTQTGSSPAGICEVPPQGQDATGAVG